MPSWKLNFRFAKNFQVDKKMNKRVFDLLFQTLPWVPEPKNKGKQLFLSFLIFESLVPRVSKPILKTVHFEEIEIYVPKAQNLETGIAVSSTS